MIMSGIIILDNKRQFYCTFVKIKAKAICVFCRSYNQKPEIHSIFPLQYTEGIYDINYGGKCNSEIILVTG